MGQQKTFLLKMDSELLVEFSEACQQLQSTPSHMLRQFVLGFLGKPHLAVSLPTIDPKAPAAKNKAEAEPKDKPTPPPKPPSNMIRLPDGRRVRRINTCRFAQPPFSLRVIDFNDPEENVFPYSTVPAVYRDQMGNYFDADGDPIDKNGKPDSKGGDPPEWIVSGDGEPIGDLRKRNMFYKDFMIHVFGPDVFDPPNPTASTEGMDD